MNALGILGGAAREQSIIRNVDLEPMVSGAVADYADQVALNDTYFDYYDRFEPKLNWKPYWPINREAVVLHFQGPKPAAIQLVASGT